MGCKIIDFTARIIDESKIQWDVAVEPQQTKDRYKIRGVPSQPGVFLIFMTVNSFEKIERYRKIALHDLRQQLSQGRLDMISEGGVR